MKLNPNQLNFLLRATQDQINYLTDEIADRKADTPEDEVREFRDEVVDMINLRGEIYRAMRKENET